MMLSKVILCAAVAIFGEVEADQAKNQPQAEQKVEQDASATTEAKSEESEKSEEPKEKAVLPDVAKTDAKADADADAEPSEDEEKEIDGIRLKLIEANIVSYTNNERARYGLPPLQVDENLMKTAREHAAWMTRNRSMTHTWRSVAENIAMGQPHSSDAVRAWMNSSGHRANILNSGHRRIGVAAFRTHSGTIFWCQQFTR